MLHKEIRKKIIEISSEAERKQNEVTHAAAILHAYPLKADAG